MSKKNVPNTCTDNIHHIKNRKYRKYCQKSSIIFIEFKELINIKSTEYYAFSNRIFCMQKRTAKSLAS